MTEVSELEAIYADLFRMTGAEVKALADKGDAYALEELARRQARRSQKRQARALYRQWLATGEPERATVESEFNVKVAR